jgi:hypothetical protein
MKKIIIMTTLLGASIQGYGATSEQVQALETLKKEIPGKVQVLKNALGEIRMPRYRDQLIDLMAGYVVLNDICGAENGADVLGMPWVSLICPKNRSVEFRQSGYRIGRLDSEKLSDITYPPRTLSPVSNGALIDSDKRDWAIHATSENPDEYDKYCKYFSTMGILAEVYLQALEHPGQIVWLQNVQNSLTYPNPEKYPPFNEDGTPNKVFFEVWYENIYVVYNRDPEMTLFYSMRQNVEEQYGKQQMESLWQNDEFMRAANENLISLLNSWSE